MDDGSTNGRLAGLFAFQGGARGDARESERRRNAESCLLALGTDVVALADADNLLSHGKVARQMEARTRRDGAPTLLSCGCGYFMYGPGRGVFTATALSSDLSPVKWLTRKMQQNLH